MSSDPSGRAKRCALLAVLALASAPAFAETVAAPTQPPPVVSVTLSLVQVDAVVTDKDGHHVMDLKADDFEILEDGKRQDVTNCAYIPLPQAPSASTVTMPAPEAQHLAPARVNPEDVRRTIALVVDDLSLSFSSLVTVRGAVRKFIRDEMQPGDLVAVIRTGSGAGALQQFTADKRVLEAAAASLRYNTLAPIDTFEAIGSDAVLARDGASGDRGNPRQTLASESLGEDAEQLRRDVFTVGTLGAVRAVITGLRDLPGRKSMLFFSSGFHFGGLSDHTDILTRLRDIVEIANRGSVVVYAVDATGLQTRSLTAADNVNAPGSAGTGPLELAQILQDRRAVAIDNHEGLSALADQTGGLFFHDQGVTRALDRIMADQTGYYLIGYAPAASSFQKTRGHVEYHKIKVNVKRPGLHVRSRAGFYGIEDDPRRGPSPHTLAGALLSPFSGGDLNVSLSSVFLHKPPDASYVRSFLHVDSKDLTFSKLDNDRMTARVDLLAVTFAENGEVVDQLNRPQDLTMSQARYATVAKSGLIFMINLPVKKPGAYQLRMAVRDLASGHVGSASQFVQVPNLGKKHLALSGILLSASRATTFGGAGDGDAADEDPETSQAVRRFHPGSTLTYSYVIYNAKTAGDAPPRLVAQTRLFRDGREMKVGGGEKPVDVGAQKGAIFGGGGLLLGPGMPPGSYVLEVAITDTQADAKHRRVAQAIDFDVTP
jgi:VWFA-related protein